MASFKSSTQIPLDIDGHQFVIDGISKTVMTAVQTITKQSAELVDRKVDEADSTQLLDQVDEMAAICKDFLTSVLGLVGYEELMADRVDDVAYLSDVCQYIMQEITAAKTARINRMMGRS